MVKVQAIRFDFNIELLCALCLSVYTTILPSRSGASSYPTKDDFVEVPATETSHNEDPCRRMESSFTSATPDAFRYVVDVLGKMYGVEIPMCERCGPTLAGCIQHLRAAQKFQCSGLLTACMDGNWR